MKDTLTGNADLEKTMPRVRLHSRIVPNGRTKDGVARATLLLTPVLAEGAPGLRLDRWSAEVVELLRGGVNARLMAVEEKNAGHVAVGEREELKFTAPGLADLDAKDIETLCGMWLGSLWQVAPDSQEAEEITADSWAALGTRIALSLDGAAVDSSGMGTANDTQPDVDLYGKDGQLAPQEGAAQAASLRVEAALDIRHADLAVAMEGQRAGALAASLNVACGSGETPKAPPLVRDPVPEGEDYWKNVNPLHTDKKEDLAELIREIARQKPRGDESFKQYSARLKDPLTMTLEDVRKALRENENVIAELRRSRNMGERSALFEKLAGPRAQSATAYRNAKSALESPTCGGSADPEWGDPVTPAKAARDEVDFEDITRSARYANWPQYRENADPPTAAQQSAQDCAAQAFFTMQSTPTLARAAMLAIDLVLDGPLPAVDLNYAHVRADLGEHEASGRPRAWTLCRLRDFGDPRAVHFWPVSREEVECDVSPPPQDSVRHVDGLMVMGFGAGRAANTPRFDITSLDIRTAVELELQRRNIAAANDQSDDEVEAQPSSNAERSPGAATTQQRQLPPGVNPKGEPTAISDQGDRQDIGLTLLDRGLCAQAIRKMAARDLKLCKVGETAPNGAVCKDEDGLAVVLDGEDLITGYRLHVGTPKDNETNWHPLMARAIRFGTTGPRWRHSDRIETVLGRLIGRFGSPERVALESAALNAPGRMLPKSAVPKEGAPGDEDNKVLPTEAVFEQAISVWDGGPMGVDCDVPEGSEKTTADALIFGRELSIPRGAAYAIPRLRYGRPYRFALAAVFAGGRSVDPGDFPDDDVSDVRADLYFPSLRMRDAAKQAVPAVQPYVRATRQAKIGAPQVLLPEGHALRDNGPMGPDQAGLMLVRSLDDDEKNPKDRQFKARGQPGTARRVVLIPSIPLARAAAHMGEPDPDTGSRDPALRGVFDTQTTTRGGLRFLRQQPGGGGFPALRTRYLKGLNGVQHFDRRDIEDRPGAAALSEADDLEGAVFAAGSSADSAYYPDPAAEALAFRVRLRGGPRDRDGWLTLDPDAMPDAVDALRPLDLVEGQRYPDRRRALLTLHRLKTRTEPADTLEKLVAINPDRRFDPAHRRDADKGGPFHARELILRLAPHEWAEVEMWLLPSAKRLARDFAVIQSLGIQLAQCTKADVGSTVADMCAGAGLTLPEELARTLADRVREIGGGQAFFGPGGVTAPPMGALLELAKIVRHCMVRHPIPEIAAVARIEAVHAANRATAAPVIRAATDLGLGAAIWQPDPRGATPADGALRGFRPVDAVSPVDPAPEEEPVAAADAPEAGQRPDDTTPPDVCTANASEIAVAARGSTGLVLTGDVELDLNQIDTIEVRARMAFPGSTTFDDRLRGRSLAQRRAGWWPLVDDPAGRRPDADGVFRDAQSLFGFYVYPDGRTAFDRAEVTLLRAERLPRPTGSTCTRTLPLRNLFEGVNLGDVRVTDRHLFPDGKARRMFVRINGLPRTAEFMRTAARRLRRGDLWIAAEGLHYEAGDLAPSTPLRAKAQCRFSNEVEVILPATIRPAKPDARAPVPLMQHERPAPADAGRDVLIHRRRSVIRIPLGREWFSSGEDERLGIVLWPPSISAEHDQALRENKVTLSKGPGTDKTRVIDLNDRRKLRIGRSAVPADATRGTGRRRLVDLICALGGASEDPAMPFEDDFLGPGGRFVSRRGADPVREGEAHRQILFAHGDFPDLDREPEDPRRAELVPMVKMPLSDDAAEQPGEAREKEPPMLVSLVTYRPRFDPEREEWYVDVALEDSTAAETFVRFGLVRYQPHTRPGLRASRPVRQFVQPLPDRIADVTRLPATTDTEGGIRIGLCGPTFHRRRVSRALADLIAQDDGRLSNDRTDAGGKSTPDDLWQNAACAPVGGEGIVRGAEAAPRMKVTVFRNGTDAFGRPYREVVPLPAAVTGRDHGLLLPADHDTGVIGPRDYSEVRRDHFWLDKSGAAQAGSIAVKAAFTEDGEGLWVLKIPDAVLGDFRGLELQVEELEAFEPADPPTREELDGRPALSKLVRASDIMSSPSGSGTDLAVAVAEDENTNPTSENAPAEGTTQTQGAEAPNMAALGVHHTGARMRAVFDLSGWANDHDGTGGN